MVWTIVQFCVWIFSFSNTIHWSGCLFHIAYSCLLCHIQIAHLSVASFLGSLLCSVDPCVRFVPIPCCFDDYSFLVVQFETKKYDTSSFVLFSQDSFGYSEPLVFSYKFRIIIVLWKTQLMFWSGLYRIWRLTWVACSF